MVVSGTGTPIADLPAHQKTRADFWLKKLESNVIRDIQVKSDLELFGWRVITVWECELSEPDQLADRLNVKIESDNGRSGSSPSRDNFDDESGA
jgi:G:T-mismatch repair DNA endonuclease (very short patch repair protein)